MSRSVFVAAFAAVLAALAPLSSGAAARQASIQGVVVDASTNQPLALAAVSLYRPQSRVVVTTAYTGKDGRFRLANLVPGDYQIVVLKQGFQGQVISGLSIAQSEHVIVGTPIALHKASLLEEQTQREQYCDTLLRPGEVADVYVVCGGH